MKLNQNLKEFIELLNSNNVEFVIVGAHALAHYGWPRFTGDIDIALRCSQENAVKTFEAICEFGFGNIGITEEDLKKPKNVIQLGMPPNRIDLITTLDGVEFDDVWNDKVASDIDGIPIHFISKKHFIQNKKAVGRPKDLGDIGQLEGE
jgi:hypothetical protein